MLRSFLLASCLLVCLACATAFPIESLEKGMTMEQATEAFGEPSSTNTQELSEAVRLLQKENRRIYERLDSPVDLSETRLLRCPAHPTTDGLSNLDRQPSITSTGVPS